MKSMDEKAVSEVIGVVLLISVTVLGVALVAVTYFSQPAPSEIPHVNVVAGATADNATFILSHEGGDALAEGSYRIYVETESGLEDQTDKFALEGDDDVWSIGENLTYKGTPGRVVISVVDSGGGEMMIAEPAYVAGAVDAGGYVDEGGSGTMPVVTVMPMPTPELVAIVLPEAGGDLVTNNQEFIAKVNASNTAYVHLILYALSGVGSAGSEEGNQDESKNKMIVINMTPSKTIALFYNHTVQNINSMQNGNADTKVSMTVIAYDANNTPIASAVEIGILKKHNNGG